MLHPVYLLTFAEGQEARLLATGAKAWRRTLLVPRRLCVYESLPCKGLAWHERRSFARLQAKRLEPFAQAGCSSVVRGQMLSLWFWDAEELGQLLAPLKLDLSDWHICAESLYLRAPRGDGPAERPCQDGIEQWTLQGGAILRSSWRAGPAVSPQWATRAWARDLQALTPTRKVESPPLQARLLQVLHWLPHALLLASLLWLGYSSMYWWSGSRRLQWLEEQASLADRRILDMSSLGSEAKRDSEWLQHYRNLAASVPFDETMALLQPVLAQSGVVIKEFELRDDQLRLQVVTAGGNIDLPELLRRLSDLPGFSEVQLRENNELSSASFGIRLAGLKRLLQPLGERQ